MDEAFLHQLASSLPSNGELAYNDRLRIFRQLSQLPVNNGNIQTAQNTSSNRNPLLHLLCARRSIWAWSDVFPHDDEPISLLEMAVALANIHANLRGILAANATTDESQDGGSNYKEDWSVFQRQLASFHTKLDDLSGTVPFRAIYAGWACMRAAEDNIAYEIEGKEGVEYPESEQGEYEISPEEWSPCYFASLVESGGAVWEDGADSEARKKFWIWYLLEAIPEVVGFRR